MARNGSQLFAIKLHIATVVCAYWFVSIVTVFINKELLSSDTVNLDAPLFITWYQCLVSTVLCFTLSKMAAYFPKIISFPDGAPLQASTVRKVLPLSLLFIGMIAFNNLCLKHVGVAFYYVGRSLTTVFNVVLTYLVLGQNTSCKAVLCCSLIVSGFWLGVDQEHVSGSLSVTGTVFGVLGSISLSMYSIYMKQVLPAVSHNIWLITYYNNFYSTFLFLPLIIMNGEIPEILNYDKLNTYMFWSLMTIGGLCGFAIGYVTALQIKVTSPLTHNISGTAKACAQTVLASYWYNESKTVLWWLSNYIVLAGSALYTRVKQLEMEKVYAASLQTQQSIKV